MKNFNDTGNVPNASQQYSAPPANTVLFNKSSGDLSTGPSALGKSALY